MYGRAPGVWVKLIRCSIFIYFEHVVCVNFRIRLAYLAFYLDTTITPQFYQLVVC